jgi:fatty acid desaturase
MLIFFVPSLMWLLGSPSLSLTSLLSVILHWHLILVICSYIYCVIAINSGHYGVVLEHSLKENEGLDFGIYQMSATVDKIEGDESLAFNLTHFGDHVMHHMFPSVDQAFLPQLRDLFIETCNEFDKELKKYEMLHQAILRFKLQTANKSLISKESNAMKHLKKVVAELMK